MVSKMKKDELKFVDDPLIKESQKRILAAQFAKAMMNAFEFGYEYGKLNKDDKK